MIVSEHGKEEIIKIKLNDKLEILKYFFEKDYYLIRHKGKEGIVQDISLMFVD
jgi:hypothetical protein